MKTLPLDWDDRIHQVHQSTPFVWCWNFQLERNATANTHAWLTPYPAPITVGSRTFYPYPMQISDVEESGEGDLPQMQVSLSNHGRVIAPYLEVTATGEGLIGSPATAFIVNLDDLSDNIELTFRVASAALDNDSCTLTLELENLYDRLVPNYRVNAQLCGWQFGTGTTERPSPCGYIINAFAAYTACNRSVGDCILRGDDEDLRNLPRLHPLRFGGFLGVPDR